MEKMCKDDINVMREKNPRNQYLLAIFVNLLTVTYGVAGGWPSPNIPLLQSDKSPLPSGKITLDEASWMAAVLSIGGLLGNLFWGVVTSYFGRKWPIIAIAIPNIISWVLILFAQNVYYLYVGRILNGLVGGGLFVIVPLFYSEIANDRIRGLLGSTMVLSLNLGIILAFVLGSYCGYDSAPKFAIAATIISLIGLFYFPESPSFLLQQNRVFEAEKSLRFYQNVRGNAADGDMIEIEMNTLRSLLDGNNINKKCEKNHLEWSDILKAPGRKAMTIGIVLAVLNQCCGTFAMLNYTVSIFVEAGSSMSPSNSAIIIAVIQFIGSYISSFLVEKTGRKFLFLVSTVGTALSLITLGLYMMLKTWHYDVERFNWIPIASFASVILIANLAITTLPWMVISEVMPNKLKNFGSSFCLTLMWILVFIMIKFLPFFIKNLEFHGTMFSFASACLSSALFIALKMPETKGRSHEEIMNSLR